MRIEKIIWINKFVQKIDQKHGVNIEEVEDTLSSNPLFRLAQRGHVKGEDLYFAYGRTSKGRHLFVVFVWKRENAGLVISARNMTQRERRYYNVHKKKT
ncbi:MAG: BrnT family toxin [Dehalococcoidia bacterium]|nr:BrnT family toxin [Dehalococcoidia bacterium]